MALIYVEGSRVFCPVPFCRKILHVVFSKERGLYIIGGCKHWRQVEQVGEQIQIGFEVGD